MTEPTEAAVPAAVPSGLLRQLRRITFVDALGSGAFIAAQVVLFTQLFALSTGAVSTALAIAGVVSAALLLPVGRLADHISLRTAMTGTNVVLVAATLVLFLSPDQWVLAVVLGLLTLGARTVSVVRGAALGKLTGPDRTAQRARNRAAFNLGMALGGLVAAGLVAIGSHWALRTVIGLDVVSFAVCAIASLGLDASRPTPATGRRLSLVVLRDGRFLLACLANAVGCLHNGLLFVALPLWIAASHAVPVLFIPIITLVNTALVVALQRRLAGDADGVRAGARLQARSAVLLLVGCVLMFAAQPLPVLGKCVVIVLAVVVWSVTEMWQSAAGWAIGYDLSPTDRLAEYQALFQLSASLEVVLSPVLTAAVIVVLPAGLGWLVVGAGALVVLLAVQAALMATVRDVEVTAS